MGLTCFPFIKDSSENEIRREKKIMLFFLFVFFLHLTDAYDIYLTNKKQTQKLKNTRIFVFHSVFTFIKSETC